MNDRTVFPIGDAAEGPVTYGSLLEFPRDPIACMRGLRATHGDLAVLEDQGQRLVFVFSPELNRQVLTDAPTFHSQFFAVRGGRRTAQRRVTAGLLSQNGTQHRDMRRILKDVFVKRVLPAYLETIARLTGELCGQWSTGDQVDLNTSMVQYMLGITSALLFGEEDQEFAVFLGRMIDRWVHQNHRTGMGALVSAPEFAEEYERLLGMADELEVAVRELIARRKRAMDDRTNALSLLLAARQSGGGLTDEDLVGQTTLLFGAAHLTTAHTLSWTLFLLSQFPHVLARLQDEFDDGIAAEVPTYEELESLRYLDCVIRESMRVLPASSYSQRVTAEATELGGVRLGPGTPVVFSQFITHHRADLYDKPDCFLPERWLEISPTAYEYLPFGAGPRMCIGAPLAMLELRAALAMMLRDRAFQIQSDSVVDGRVISTMLGPVSPIHATVLGAGQRPETAPVHGSIHDLVSLPEAARAQRRRAA